MCRRLVDAGAHVAPVLTRGALKFVGEKTFSALASEPARTSLWESDEPIPHTRLGQGADLVIVAPATARILGSYAAGISSDLLTATLLATRAPVLVCPAMHTEMWEHPAVAENVATLKRRGVHVVEPAAGRLAGGDSGAGRLADPADIVAAATHLLSGSATPGRSGSHPAPGRSGRAAHKDLAGVRAVVTAGGTREPIDPVRYVGNRSSGKQGYAVAEELRRRGADVVLITTVNLPVTPSIETVEVETASEMQREVLRRAEGDKPADVIVMAAAVADFRPKSVADAKIKKDAGVPEIVLEQTSDILAELGRRRSPHQTLVGFAAETPTDEELLELAQRKLKAKGADLLVANDVSAPGVGFAHDTNAVTIVTASGTVQHVRIAGKAEVATAVVDAIVAHRGVAHRGADGRAPRDFGPT